MATSQLDLLDLLPPPWEEPAPSLYDSPTRGVQERAAEFAAWQRAHDEFACYSRSHAWHVEIIQQWSRWMDQLPERCLPTILQADLRCPSTAHHHNAIGGCSCVGGLVRRGACWGCTWEGPVRGRVAQAVEDAHDHAWPGWRDLVAVPRFPDDPSGTPKKRQDAAATWMAAVDAVYPAGWLAAGGPYVTVREPNATRDIPSRSPFGGYDLAARASHVAAGAA